MSFSMRLGWAILGTALLLVLLWYFQSIIAYLCIGAVLSLIGRPLVNLALRLRFRKWSAPSWLGALIAMLAIYGFFALIFVLLIPPLLQQVSALQSIDVAAIEQGLREPIKAFEAWANRYQLAAEDISVERYLRSSLMNLVATVDFNSVLNSIVGFTGDFVIALFSVTFILFFFLKEPNILPEMIQAVTPVQARPKLNRALRESRQLLTRYLIGILIQIICVATLVTIGLWAIGVKNAPVIGFFCGLFNVIPYLGPIIGAVTGLLLTTLGNLELDFYTVLSPLLIKALIVFLGVQLIDNFVFQPLIYGKSVKAHPLEIFIVILMAGNLGGIAGMVLAIPMYTILRVLAREFLYHFEVVRSLTKDMAPTHEPTE